MTGVSLSGEIVWATGNVTYPAVIPVTVAKHQQRTAKHCANDAMA